MFIIGIISIGHLNILRVFSLLAFNIWKNTAENVKILSWDGNHQRGEIFSIAC
jgi:hypothetical protein